MWSVVVVVGFRGLIKEFGDGLLKALGRKREES
jgi:hypothetical protein